MRTLLLLSLVADVALADISTQNNGTNVGTVTIIDAALDGGLQLARSSQTAKLRCAVASPYTRGCVEPGDQTFTGPKRTTGGTQNVCVAHGSLTACSAGNAGMHQCCSTHSNAAVYCDGATNREVGPQMLGFAFNTTASSALDSNTNGIAGGIYQSFTITSFSGIYTAGTGTTAIQFECLGLTSGKRCFTNVSCNGATHGFDGGTYISVPSYSYGGSATGCTFSGEMVYCLGRSTPIDGGTDCAGDPKFEKIRIEGTIP